MATNENDNENINGKKKNSINTPWLKNAAKSIGSLGYEQVMSYAPTIKSGIETSKKVAQSGADAVRNMVKSGSPSGYLTEALKKNKYVASALRGYKNAIDDLKSGNFNNTERQPPSMADLDSGGAEEGDISFGNEDAEMSDGDTINNINIESSDSTFVVESINKQTVAQLETGRAKMQAQVAMTSTLITQNKQLHDETISVLTDINKNIASLVQYNKDNMTKFIEVATAFMENMGKKSEPEVDSSDDESIKASDLFDPTKGTFNFSNYKDYIVKNFKEGIESSVVGMVKTMADPEMIDMILTNPLGELGKMVIDKLIPRTVKDTIQNVETSINNAIPTMLARIGAMYDPNNRSTMGIITNLFAKTFGLHIDNRKETINGGAKINKGPVPFDGITRHTIAEIIPKELREQTAYLKAIAEKYNIDTNAARGNASVFDWEHGRYISLDEATNSLIDTIKRSIVNAFDSGKFGKELESFSLSMETDDKRKAMDSLIEQFKVQAEQAGLRKNGSAVEIGNADNELYKEIMGNLVGDKDLIKQLDKQLQLMRRDDASAMSNYLNALILSSKERDDILNRIEENPYEYNLYATELAGLNIDDVLSNSYVYKDKKPRSWVNKVASKLHLIPNQDNNIGGYIPVQQIETPVNTSAGNETAVGKAINEISKTARSSIDRIVNRKTSSSGSEGSSDSEEGDRRSSSEDSTVQSRSNTSGSISKSNKEFGDYASDIFKSLKHAVTGEAYTASDGTVVEYDENSVLGKFKSIASAVKEGLATRILGDRDENGQRKGGIVGSIRDVFVEGVTGWKNAIFGEDADSDEIKQNLIEKFKATMPTALTGSAIGLVGGAAAGGSVLGWLVGGPVGGAVLGLAGGILSKSSKFQEFLFGKEDENGEKTGGVVPQYVQDFVKKNKNFIIGGGTLGAISGQITGGGLLGSLVGGPIAGAMLGIASSMIIKSNAFQNMLFGKEQFDENGNSLGRSGGILDTVKSTFGQFSNKIAGSAGSIGKTLGMAGLGIGAGVLTAKVLSSVGVLGASLGPFGPIGGALLGLGLAIKASSGNFRKWLFGSDEVDEDGNKDGGVLGRVSNFLRVEILDPFKIKAAYLMEDARYTLGNVVDDIGTGLSNMFEPITSMVSSLKDEFKGVFSELGNMILSSASSAIQFLVKPLRAATSLFASVVYGTAKKMITVPAKVFAAITSPVLRALIKVPAGIIKGVGKVTSKLILKPITKFVISPLVKLVSKIGKTFRDYVFYPIRVFGTYLLRQVTKLPKLIGRGIAGLAKSAFGGVKNLISGLFGTLGKGKNKVSKLFGGVKDKVANSRIGKFASEQFGKGKKAANSLKEGIGGKATSIYDAVRRFDTKHGITTGTNPDIAKDQEKSISRTQSEIDKLQRQLDKETDPDKRAKLQKEIDGKNKDLNKLNKKKEHSDNNAKIKEERDKNYNQKIMAKAFGYNGDIRDTEENRAKLKLKNPGLYKKLKGDTALDDITKNEENAKLISAQETTAENSQETVSILGKIYQAILKFAGLEDESEEDSGELKESDEAEESQDAEAQSEEAQSETAEDITTSETSNMIGDEAENSTLSDDESSSDDTSEDASPTEDEEDEGPIEVVIVGDETKDESEEVIGNESGPEGGKSRSGRDTEAATPTLNTGDNETKGADNSASVLTTDSDNDGQTDMAEQIADAVDENNDEDDAKEKAELVEANIKDENSVEGQKREQEAAQEEADKQDEREGRKSQIGLLSNIAQALGAGKDKKKSVGVFGVLKGIGSGIVSLVLKAAGFVSSLFSIKGVILAALGGAVIKNFPAIVNWLGEHKEEIWNTIKSIGSALANVASFIGGLGSALGNGLTRDSERTEEHGVGEGKTKSERWGEEISEAADVVTGGDEGRGTAVKNWVLNDENEADSTSGSKMRAMGAVGSMAFNKGAKVVNTVAKVTVDKTVVDDSGGIVTKVVRMISKFVSKIASFVLDKLGVEVGESVTKTIITELTEAAIAHSPKWMSPVISLLGKTAAVTATGVGWVLDKAGGLTVGSIVGATDAGTAAIFQINQEDVNGTMKIIAAIIQAVLCTDIGSIVECVIDVVAQCTGTNWITQLATLFYNAVCTDNAEKLDHLKESQSEFDEQYDRYYDAIVESEYNDAVATGAINGDEVSLEQYKQNVADGRQRSSVMSFQDYNTQANHTALDTVGDAFSFLASTGDTDKWEENAKKKALTFKSRDKKHVVEGILSEQSGALVITKVTCFYSASEKLYYVRMPDGTYTTYTVAGQAYSEGISEDTVKTMAKEGLLVEASMPSDTLDNAAKDLQDAYRAESEAAYADYKTTIEGVASMRVKLGEDFEVILDEQGHVRLPENQKTYYDSDGNFYLKQGDGTYNEYSITGSVIKRGYTEDDIITMLNSGLLWEGETPLLIDESDAVKDIQQSYAKLLNRSLKSYKDAIAQQSSNSTTSTGKTKSGFYDATDPQSGYNSDSFDKESSSIGYLKPIDQKSSYARYRYDDTHGISYYIKNSDGTWSYYVKDDDGNITLNSNSDNYPDDNIAISGLRPDLLNNPTGKYTKEKNLTKALGELKSRLEEKYPKIPNKYLYYSFLKDIPYIYDRDATAPYDLNVTLANVDVEKNKELGDAENKSAELKKQVDNSVNTTTPNGDDSFVYEVGGYGDGGDELASVTDSKPSSILNGFKYYSQTDDRWSAKDYSSPDSEGDMESAGCAPTAMAMVASQLTNKDIDPTKMASFAEDNGYRNSKGTSGRFISHASSNLGLEYDKIRHPSPLTIAESLEKGNPVILSGKKNDGTSSPFTKAGHYVVATRMDENGKVMVNDPRGEKYSKPYSLSDLTSDASVGWSFNSHATDDSDMGASVKARTNEGAKIFKNDDSTTSTSDSTDTSETSTDTSSLGSSFQTTTANSGDIVNGAVYYNQGDSPWKTMALGNSTIGSTGCVLTSYAMGASSVSGQQITPETLITNFKSDFPGGCISWGNMNNDLKSTYGIDVEQVMSEDDAKQKLASGIPIVMYGSGMPYTSAGSSQTHAVFGTTTTADGNSAYINDPGSRKWTTSDDMRTRSLDSLWSSGNNLNGGKKWWAFSKDGKGVSNLSGGLSGSSSSTGSTGSSDSSSSENTTILDKISGILGTAFNTAINGVLTGDWTIHENTTDSTSYAGSASSTNVTGNDNTEKIWNYLTGTTGLDKYATAGFMGCWEAESGNDPDTLEGYYLQGAKNMGGAEKIAESNESLDTFTTDVLFPAYARRGKNINKSAYKGEDGHYYPGFGLAQWTGPRGQTLMSWSKQNNLDWRELGTQLAYLDWELKNNKRGTVSSYNGTTNVEDATWRAMKLYEGNDSQSYYNDRLPRAKEFYNLYANKSATSTTGNEEDIDGEGFGDGTTSTTPTVTSSDLNTYYKSVEDAAKETANASNYISNAKSSRDMNTALFRRMCTILESIAANTLSAADKLNLLKDIKDTGTGNITIQNSDSSRSSKQNPIIINASGSGNLVPTNQYGTGTISGNHKLALQIAKG